MNSKKIITDKQVFHKTASRFFNILFGKSINKNGNEIEIRGFDNGPRHQSYHNNVADAVEAAYQVCQNGFEVYVGVNPRVGQAGNKENVRYLAAFHAEVDFEQTGHKKKPEYNTEQDALSAITAFEIPPTLVVHSGGGFHCYWVLNNPADVSEMGLDALVTHISHPFF